MSRYKLSSNKLLLKIGQQGRKKNKIKMQYASRMLFCPNCGTLQTVTKVCIQALMKTF